MLEYSTTDHKRILRTMEDDILALVVIDIASGEYEVVYSDGSYRDYDVHRAGGDFFNVWVSKGVALVWPDDRERMMQFLDKKRVLSELARRQTLTTTCRFRIGKGPVHCRVKLMRDVPEPGRLALSIRNIEREIMQEQDRTQQAQHARELETTCDELKDRVERLQTAMEQIRLIAQQQRKRIHVKTFGRFTVLLDDVPVPLRGKAKEILALVVAQRGKEISNEAIYRTIWENRPCSNANMTVYYNALRRLKNALEQAGIPELLVSTTRGQMVDTSLFDCDYYDLLDGVEGGDDFAGEFMSEYSWGEYTVGALMNKLYER